MKHAPKKKTDPSGTPDQKELIRTCIRPGRNADIILVTDFDRDMIDVRSGLIHDTDKKGRLILSQTTPPLSNAHRGREVDLTILARFRDRPGGRWLRFGYKTTILGVLDNVRLGADQVETVVVVPGPKKLTEYTLRLNYRLVPPGDSGLDLFLWPDRTRLSILDISAGGAKFSHPSPWVFEPGQQMNLAISKDEETLIFKSQVVRSGEVLGVPGARLGSTAVKFIEVSPEDRRKLVRMIQRIARRDLAKRSGLLDDE